MEVYEAKFDYVKQRKDVLSFRRGDKFYIIERPNDEWWSAKKLSDNTFGFVPAIYLEKSNEQIIGRLVPEGRRNTPAPSTKREHDIHLQALAELHQRVKPLPGLTRTRSCPVHVIGQALGMDIPKEAAPAAPHHLPTHRQQIVIPDIKVEEKLAAPTEKVRSPPPISSRSPRNSYKGNTPRGRSPSPQPLTKPKPRGRSPSPQPLTKPKPRGRSPSPQPFPKPKPKNGSLRRDDQDSLPYHHKSPPPPVTSPPPPDYDLDDDDTSPDGVPYHHKLNSSGRFIELSEESLEGPPMVTPTSPPHMPPGVPVDGDGLILPKPLPNPVLESPQHRSLHRELRVSGRKVLNQQTELDKVFRDRKDRSSKKQLDEQKMKNRTSLDIRLDGIREKERLKEEEENRKKLEVLEKAAREPEFFNVHLKSRSGSNKT